MKRRIGDIPSSTFYRDARNHRNRLLNEMFEAREQVDVLDPIAIDDNNENIQIVNPIELIELRQDDINQFPINLNEPIEIQNENVEREPIELRPDDINQLHRNQNEPNEFQNGIIERDLPPVPFNYADEDSNGEYENYDQENSNDEDENVVEENDPESYRSKLATFVKKSNLSRKHTNELLELQREHGHLELPKTKETLCGTPRYSIHPRPCGDDGEYYHFGIEKSLMKCNYRFLFEEEVVLIDIGIDGISLSKSSRLKIWPIIGGFVDKPNISPFLIGCYKGTTNPPCINSFIEDFVEELKIIEENGVKVTPASIIKPLRIRAFICDTPARSFVTGCLGHGSYFGCSKCDQEGDYNYNKVVYQPVRGNSRTDISFSDREQPQHHQPKFLNEPSLLETMQIGMVTQFPLDPMHAVDSGIMKRMLGSILNGPCQSSHLRGNGRIMMDAVNLGLIPYIPSEFERKPRSLLTEYTRFKAVEFRLFLLYTGCVVLKDYTSPELYSHFLLLFTGIRTLSSLSTCLANADFADELLKQFVADYARIYDPSEMVFNVHAILHLVECVRQFGALYSFSAYRFENYMREIKKHIKSPSKILQQMFNRLAETNIINQKREHIGFVGREFDSDIFPGCNTSYKSFQFGSFILKSNLKDSCCMITDGTPIEVQGFGIENGEKVLFAKHFINMENFFTEPVESMSYLAIMLVDAPGEAIFTHKVTDVDYKMIRLPYQTRFVIMPMIHHLRE